VVAYVGLPSYRKYWEECYKWQLSNFDFTTPNMHVWQINKKLFLMIDSLYPTFWVICEPGTVKKKRKLVNALKKIFKNLT